MVLTERRNWPLLNRDTPQFVSKRKERWHACSDKVGEVQWSRAPAHFGHHSFMTGRRRFGRAGEARMDHTVRPSKIGLEPTGADRCEYFMESVGQRVSGSSFPTTKPRNAKDIAAEITAADMYRGWRNAIDSAAGPYSSFDMDPTFDMEPEEVLVPPIYGAHARRQMDPNAEVFVPTIAAPHGRYHLCESNIKTTQAELQIKCLREGLALTRKTNDQSGRTRKSSGRCIPLRTTNHVIQSFESLRPRTCDEVLSKYGTNDSRKQRPQSEERHRRVSPRKPNREKRRVKSKLAHSIIPNWNGIHRKGLKYRGLLSHQPRHGSNGRFIRS